MRSDLGRRILLVLTALVFVGIALASMIMPHTMAAGLSYKLENVDALSEFRAVYGGVWLATAALLLVAARRVREPLLGDLGALLVLGQPLGRLLSLALDGLPDKVWPMFALEALGALAILLVRPSRAPDGDAEGTQAERRDGA